MTPVDALEMIHEYAAANRIAVTDHARRRMRERGVTFGDLQHALANASSCSAQESGTWRADGRDRDGDELTVVVAIEDGLIVVTLF